MVNTIEGKVSSFKKLATNLIASQLILPVLVANSDSSLQDQLKVVQALQVEEQINRVDNERKIVKKSNNNNFLIAKGLIALPASTNEDVDPLSFPLGFMEATSLDSSYGSKDAALFITAIGKQGPPLAAQKYSLNQIKFPFYFEITSDDLLFPYTPAAFVKNPISKDAIAVTAIIDCDGILSTPNTCERFGFAISDPIKVDDLITRTEAKITVSLKSDGKPYDDKDIELLSRVDSELKRLGTKKI